MVRAEDDDRFRRLFRGEVIIAVSGNRARIRVSCVGADDAENLPLPRAFSG
jgi:hypothetical protein